MTQHYEAAFRGSGLRATQFTVLTTLAEAGPLPMTRLAAMLGLERTTLTRNLDPLLHRKLVTLSGAADARIREVAIAPAGEALARETLPRWQSAQASVGPLLEQHGLPTTLS